jgi:vanillate O-demethylase monooxygenase subunit
VITEREAGGSEKRMSSSAANRFLRNTWYMAMWSQDLEPGKLLARRILNESIVFFRKTDGSVAALADVCPHRFAPLHLGALLPGDRVQCGYHGLEFDAGGSCIFNPHGNGTIPPGAQVRSYPVVEKHTIVWIWMGTEAADAAAIPDFSVFDGAPSEHVSRRDHIVMNANYDLVTYNLLDLSHVSYLHSGILGNAETIKAAIDVRQDGDTVYVSRCQENVTVPPLMRLTFKPEVERGDLWRTMRWDPPGCMLLDFGVKDVGTPRESGSGYYGVHILTPETGTTTHYHFSSVRHNVLADETQLNEEIRREISRLRRFAFEEQDAPMIEAQQRLILELEENGKERRPALLAVDAGPARYRRVMDRLLQEESAAD